MQPNDPQSLSQLMDGEWQGLDPSDCAASACRDPALQAKWARWHLIRDALHNEPLRVESGLAERVRVALRDEPAYSNVASIGGDRLASTSVDQPVAGSDDAAEAARGMSATSAAGGMAERRGPVTAATRGMSLRGGLGGFALVASVALVTAVGINLWRDAAPLADGVPVTASVPVPTADVPIGELASAGPVDTARRRVLPAEASQAPFVAPVPGASGTHWVTSATDRVSDAENRLNLLLSQHIESSPAAETGGMLPYSRLIGYDALGQ